MVPVCRAYVDIETTGFSTYSDEITVIGICVERGRTLTITQLYDDILTKKALLAALRPARALYSYNGAAFDLRFIREQLNADLARHLDHCDLMYHCHGRNLYGGLKSVERRLRIPRKSKGVDGAMAVELWYDYRENRNERALRRLLEYNEEDVRNLVHLRRKLGVP